MLVVLLELTVFVSAKGSLLVGNVAKPADAAVPAAEEMMNCDDAELLSPKPLELGVLLQSKADESEEVNVTAVDVIAPGSVENARTDAPPDAVGLL